MVVETRFNIGVKLGFKVRSTPTELVVTFRLAVAAPHSIEPLEGVGSVPGAHLILDAAAFSALGGGGSGSSSGAAGDVTRRTHPVE
jgi:hypothetical protein